MLCLPFLPDFFVALPISRSPLEIPVIVIAFSEITRKAVASQRGTPVDILKAFPFSAGSSKDPEAWCFRARCLACSGSTPVAWLLDGSTSLVTAVISASGSSSESNKEDGCRAASKSLLALVLGYPKMFSKRSSNLPQAYPPRTML